MNTFTVRVNAAVANVYRESHFSGMPLRATWPTYAGKATVVKIEHVNPYEVEVTLRKESDGHDAR